MVVIFAVIFLILKQENRLQKNFSPGPPTLPFIGNVHQVGYDLKKALKGCRENYITLDRFQLGRWGSVVISDSVMISKVLKDGKFFRRAVNHQEHFSIFF